MAHHNLGLALDVLGKSDEAMAQYQKSLEIAPNYAEAHCQLGNALVSEGRSDEAIAHFQKALKLDPNFLEAQNNLAWLWATWPEASSRNGAEAMKLALHAVELTGGRVPGILDTLAAAYAEAGRFSEAIQTVRKAIQLAEQQERQALVDALHMRLSLYEAEEAYHEKPAKGGRPRPGA